MIKITYLHSWYYTENRTVFPVSCSVRISPPSPVACCSALKPHGQTGLRPFPSLLHPASTTYFVRSRSQKQKKCPRAKHNFQILARHFSFPNWDRCSYRKILSQMGYKYKHVGHNHSKVNMFLRWYSEFSTPHHQFFFPFTWVMNVNLGLCITDICQSESPRGLTHAWSFRCHIMYHINNGNVLKINSYVVFISYVLFNEWKNKIKLKIYWIKKHWV